jgi:hypothetical protein
MPIPSIYFIPLFIIKESSNILQGFCNCAPNPGGRSLPLQRATAAPNSGGRSLLLQRATAATTIATAIAFIFRGEAVACSNFS